MGRNNGAWLAIVGLALTSAAHAQTNEPDVTAAPPAAATPSEAETPPEPAAETTDVPGDTTTEASDDCLCPPPQACPRRLVAPGPEARGPMGTFGLSLKLGVAGQGKRSTRVDGMDTGKAPAKTGLLVGLAFNTGAGHGFGSDVAFNLRRFDRGGVKSGTFTFEPILGGRFHLKGPGYLFVGVGPSLGLGWNDIPDAPKSGVGGFRIPVQGTVYFWRKLAAVVELGLGWDAAVTIDEDPNDPEAKVAYIDTGMTWDLAFGIRFY